MEIAPGNDEKQNARPRQLSATVRWYEANIERLVEQYESVPAASLHAWLVPFLPKSASRILDVGAGTGRDAAWLASQGLDVVAIEPSPAMRRKGQALHPSPSIHWVDDELPSLGRLHQLGLSFDFILLSAVWMHVAPADRQRAFRKLITLLEPGGAIALSLREGPTEASRAMYPVSLGEIEQLAASHGAFVQKAERTVDELGRQDVTWTQVLVRLPDDGTGALPFLRHIILNDDKSSTYKLALLRVLSRITDGAAGMARTLDAGSVAVPLGLVGLYWLRLFKPLLAAGLPQTPRNTELEGLGFVREGFKAIGSLSAMDLRVGAQFDQSGPALHAALKDACQTISRMPARFITYPNGEPVFPTKRPEGRSRPQFPLTLDEAYLAAFGEFLVPEHLWRALRRFDVWIEPALVAEWTKLIKDYAFRQGRVVDETLIANTMVWADPARDVRAVRERASQILSTSSLYCVWTGRKLDIATLDIDHCIPWSSWPCGDLWNLMPADRIVNQRQKREKLPSLALLRACEARIKEWWNVGYYSDTEKSLSRRFGLEAKASLPLDLRNGLSFDDVFDGLALLQMRLNRDQQAPIWERLST